MNKVMKQFKVYQLLADYVPTDPPESDAFDITITNSVKDSNGVEHTVTLVHYTFDNVISELIQHYADWQYTMFYIDSRYNNHNNEVANFVSTWVDYKSNMFENWKRICIAYSLDYNPIENYNKIENGSTQDNDNVGMTNNSTNTTEQLTDSTVDHNYSPNGSTGVTTENYATTYDDTNNPKLAGKNVTKGAERTTANNGKTQTTYENTANTTRSNNNTHHIEMRGNIGVTTTQEMIESEMRLRRFNLLHHIIEGFADYALTYSPDEEDDYDSSFLYF